MAWRATVKAHLAGEILASVTDGRQVGSVTCIDLAEDGC